MQTARSPIQNHYSSQHLTDRRDTPLLEHLSLASRQTLQQMNINGVHDRPQYHQYEEESR